MWYSNPFPTRIPSDTVVTRTPARAQLKPFCARRKVTLFLANTVSRAHVTGTCTPTLPRQPTHLAPSPNLRPQWFFLRYILFAAITVGVLAVPPVALWVEQWAWEWPQIYFIVAINFALAVYL